MFHHSSKMQFPVRVEKPDPEFAMLLQQAIGGVEGEIRVAMQYFSGRWAHAAMRASVTC